MFRPLVVLAVLSAISLSPAIAQSGSEPDAPILEGYVTRAVSLSDLDVNGFHIQSQQKTVFGTTTHSDNQSIVITRSEPWLGESVSVFGKMDKRNHRIAATQIIFHLPDAHHLSGIAVIDRVFANGKPGEMLVRADGYRILINSSTKVNFQQPLTSLSDIKPNVWLKYHGTSSNDGILVADSVTFQPNTISHSEDKLLGKTDYDPAAVPSDSKQNAVSKYFLGLNPKKIPPYKDAAMQARIDRIGASLIPAFQRSLPNTDGSKIVFQFQLIDNKKLHDAWSLPSGVILVPYQVIERLQNDSQIATVLADNIATALEKQTYRMLPARHTMTAANLAADAGGLFVPGLGTATSIATYLSNKSIQTDLLNQSGRVSLGLLHDAGYDIDQAPITWWLLAAKPSKDLTNTALPPRAANLYSSLGTIWKNYSDAALPATTPQPTSSGDISQTK